jgi:acyl-CoA synthetase (AMP-forming)/AMP-acid ligase II
MDLFTHRDTTIQIASCSFDAHVQEIVGSLMIGCSVIMLHPYGNMNLEYVATVLYEKRISYMMTVPTFWNHLLELIKRTNDNHFLAMRSLCSCGQCYID